MLPAAVQEPTPLPQATSHSCVVAGMCNRVSYKHQRTAILPCSRSKYNQSVPCWQTHLNIAFEKCSSIGLSKKTSRCQAIVRNIDFLLNDNPTESKDHRLNFLEMTSLLPLSNQIVPSPSGCPLFCAVDSTTCNRIRKVILPPDPPP